MHTLSVEQSFAQPRYSDGALPFVHRYREYLQALCRDEAMGETNQVGDVRHARFKKGSVLRQMSSLAGLCVASRMRAPEGAN